MTNLTRTPAMKAAQVADQMTTMLTHVRRLKDSVRWRQCTSQVTTGDSAILQKMVGMLQVRGSAPQTPPQTPKRRCKGAASPSATHLYTPSEAQDVAACSPELPSTQDLMDMISDEEVPQQGMPVTHGNLRYICSSNASMLSVLSHCGLKQAEMQDCSAFLVSKAIHQITFSKMPCK